MKKTMMLTKKSSRHLIFKKAIIVPFSLLLFAFTIPDPLLVNSSHVKKLNDTLPQTEIFKLKRADIYVVIVNADMVKVRLKNSDSIVMNRTNFDALTVEVKKEISAHNDGIFSSEQIESSYPGGPSGWMAYLNRTFKYPEEAVSNSIQGTVVVQFIVDDQGKVSDIEAVSGPTSGGLREEAIRVIHKSGKWKPAIWNGYKVTSYKRQPLTFKLTR
jgi:TonB family protein